MENNCLKNVSSEFDTKDVVKIDHTSEKYSLRPRTNYCIKGIGKLNHKQKQKPPPLSKYRRRSANAKERYRMLEMNQAFEALRKIIPNYPTVQMENKLTKVTTLRMAVNYIKALSQMLEDDDNGILKSSHQDDTIRSSAAATSDNNTSSFINPNVTSNNLFCTSEDILNAVIATQSDNFRDFFPVEESGFGDNLCDTTFEDIPSFSVNDSCFDMLLESDGESLVFSSDFSDYTPTP